MTDNDRTARTGEPPAAVFQALAHRIRTGIVTTLGAADGDLAYDTVRERVGVRDSGKFNYHLGQVRGAFVEKRDGRYRLTAAGRRAYELLVAGTLGTRRVERTAETDTTCRACDGRLVATCDGTTARVECRTCGSGYQSVRFPSGGVAARDDAALLDAVDTAARQRFAALGAGVCPRCRGRVSAASRTREWQRGDGPHSHGVGLEYRCRACGGEWLTTVGEAVLDHPEVVAFFADHGIDLRDRYAWEVEFAATDRDTRLRSRDPLRLELRPQFGNDELLVMVDADGSVVRTSRHTKLTARTTWFDRPVEG